MAEKRVDIYLTDRTKNQRLHFPITPDTVNVKSGATSVAFAVIGLGEVKIPRGSQLKGYSWNGVFPDASMVKMPFVYEYAEPKTLIQTIEEWMKDGTTLELMITEVSVSIDVFIENFTYTWIGLGRAQYTITLTMRRQLTISSLPPQTKPTSTATTTGATAGTPNATVVLSNKNGTLAVRKKPDTNAEIIGKLSNGARIHVNKKTGNWYEIPWATGLNGVGYVQASYVRLDGQATQSGTQYYDKGRIDDGRIPTSTPTGSTYTVKDGDTLYSLALTLLGDGNRWQELYELNKAAIDKMNNGKPVTKNTLVDGTKLQIPEKKATTQTSQTIFKAAATGIVAGAQTVIAAVTKPTSTLGTIVQSAIKVGSSILSSVVSSTKATSVNNSTKRNTNSGTSTSAKPISTFLNNLLKK